MALNDCNIMERIKQVVIKYGGKIYTEALNVVLNSRRQKY